METTEQKMVRQGDVLLKPVESPSYPVSPRPTRVKPKNGRLILAAGEATGHHHSVVADDDTELVRVGEKMLLTLATPRTLEHQEHGPIKLPGGTYEVIPQREWTPAPVGMPNFRRVRD